MKNNCFPNLRKVRTGLFLYILHMCLKMIGFNERKSDSHIGFPLHIPFWLKTVENLASHRYIVGKGRSIIIAFQYSLMLHQRVESHFLKLNCNVDLKLYQ